MLPHGNTLAKAIDRLVDDVSLTASMGQAGFLRVSEFFTLIKPQPAPSGGSLPTMKIFSRAIHVICLI